MPEKMYGFTHLISETKLLALIASNADEVKVDIFTPERRGGARPRLPNGHQSPPLSPLMIGGPKAKASKARGKQAGIDRIPLARKWGVRKWGARHLILQTLYERKGEAVTMQELIAAGLPYGIGPGALSVAFGSMIKDGLIARAEKGQYKILKKGIAIAEPAMMNSNTPTSTEELADAT